MNALTIAKTYFDYFNQKNYQGMLDLLGQDFRHEPNQGEPRLGKAAFGQFLGNMDECYDEQLADLHFFVSESGERVACEFTVNGIYKKADAGLPAANGQSYVLPAASFLEVKNGKICRVATHYNLPLWIKLVSDGTQD